MFTNYDVKSEQLGFLEATKRAPNLTILSGSEPYASIEFCDKTRYRYQSPHCNLVGRAGVSHSDRDATSWYLSAFDVSSKVKKVEGIIRGGPLSGDSESVVAIEKLEVCTFKNDNPEVSLSRNNGEVIGRLKLLDESTGFFAKVEVLDRLDPETKDYLLILLTLLGKKHAWFVIQMPFGTCQGYPGV